MDSQLLHPKPFDFSKVPDNRNLASPISGLANPPDASHAIPHDIQQLLALPLDLSGAGNSVQVNVEHANWLLSYCSIRKESAITSLEQCSPSLFVILYKSLFRHGEALQLELPLNKASSRLNNMQIVLKALASRLMELEGIPGLDGTGRVKVADLKAALSQISAEEIIKANQYHIGQLLRLFIIIAVELRPLFPAGPHDGNVSHSASGAATFPSHKSSGSSPVDFHATLDVSGSPNSKLFPPPPPLPCSRGAQQNSVPNAAAATGTNPGGPPAGGPQGAMTKTPTGNQASNNDSAARAANPINSEDNVSNPECAYRTQQMVNRWRAKVHHPYPLPLTAYHDPNSLRPFMHHAYYPQQLTYSNTSTTESEGRPDAGPVGRDGMASIEGRIQLLGDLLGDPSIVGSHRVVNDRRRAHQGMLVAEDTERLAQEAAAYPDIYVNEYLFDPGPLSSIYKAAKTIDTVARDAKIEQLRALRQIQDATQQVRANIVSAASRAQVELQQRMKQQIKLKRQHALELKKWMKEEDARYREAFLSALISTRHECRMGANKPNRRPLGPAAAALLDAKTLSLFAVNNRELQRARHKARRVVNIVQSLEEGGLQSLEAAVTGWRYRTILH